MCNFSLSLKAGEPGRPMVWFQSEAWQAQDPGRADVSALVQRQEKNSSLKAVRQEEFTFIQGRVSPLDLFRSSLDWMRTTHSREGNLLYSAY